ncbi:MAG: peroxiredoxin [Chloroflexia bacterium]|jgi:peroxiredoxin Q/BCP|nr:peroxiredoxin [Chloroflexia bacterium]
MTLIEVGAEAPDFSLKNDEGEGFHLADLRGFVRAMLIFYPKDFTPGCTDQLIQVRRNIEPLRGAGIEPIGVNPDDAESHKAFRKEHALNFDLLVDEDAQVAHLYGAIKPDGEGIQRSVVIVGKVGKVIFAEHGAPPWQRILSVMRKTDDVPAPVS